MPTLALVIVTHAAYAKHLAAILAKVAEQRRFLCEVVLVIDGEIPTAPAPSAGLRIVRGNWRNPQLARNAGLAAVSAEWVCYLDGDNIPSAGYFSAMREAVVSAPATCGICYPGAVLRVTEDTSAERVFVMPEWCEDVAQRLSIADTSAAWRRRALLGAGGWFVKSGMLDDYTTALNLWRQGWTGKKVPGAISVLRHHENRRSAALGTIPSTLWHARRHSFVTLFAGREEPLAPLMRWFAQAVLPPQTELEWVDNSGDQFFHDELWRRAASLSQKRPEITRIRIHRAPDRVPNASRLAIHEHVATLYNLALHGITSEVIVTLEDDVIPPLDGLAPLVNPLQPWGNTGAVGGVYPCRNNPQVAVAALDPKEWRRMPLLSTLKGSSLFSVGMVGGGFTAWNGAILRSLLPMQLSEKPLLGWDGNLCARMNAAGYRSFLAPTVKCQHLFALSPPTQPPPSRPPTTPPPAPPVQSYLDPAADPERDPEAASVCS